MRKGKKIVLIVLAVILLAVAGCGAYVYFAYFNSHPEKEPGNAPEYSVAETNTNPESVLTGKRIIFLGSSVTYGSESMGESFVDYLEKMDGVIPYKEAVSGTTLVDKDSYGRASYIARMKLIDRDFTADAFVCQLSTNDATMKKPLGEISESMRLEDFDTQTVTGAMEYVIAYARETWDCPIVFYTGTPYQSRGSAEYEAMVDRLLELRDKWDITVLDLWHDPAMAAVSSEDYALYMANGIHPTRAGYRDWWTPKFEECLTEIFA